MAADRFDWDSADIPNSTKNAIAAFVYNVRSCSIEENFLVQEFQSYDDAKCVREVVRRSLVTLAPEIILPSRTTIEGDKGYLIMIKPIPKAWDLTLFEGHGFNNGPIKCLFLNQTYKNFIKDTLRIVSRLMETNVSCELDWKYLYLYGEGDFAKAKFIKFNLLPPGVANNETDLRAKLKQLFEYINTTAGINDGPEAEFCLFYNFLTNPRMNFKDIKLVERNMIFWDKGKRRNFIAQLHNLVKETNCHLHCSKTAGAFPWDWETTIDSHPDLQLMNFYNNQILEEIINRARNAPSSSSAASSSALGINAPSSSSGSQASTSRSRHGPGYLKDALTFVRHAYEHRYEIMNKGSIKFKEIRSQVPDDLVDIFHYYFPDHVMCLAKGPLITKYTSLEEFLPLGA